MKFVAKKISNFWYARKGVLRFAIYPLFASDPSLLGRTVYGSSGTAKFLCDLFVKSLYLFK
jgi:hypothetical protein